MVVPDRGSEWQHTVTGDQYTVVEPEPTSLDPDAEAHPNDDSEPFVYVSTDDYEEYENIWLARRLFDSQLERLDD